MYFTVSRNQLALSRNELIEDETNDIVVIESDPARGKYTFQRLKNTGDAKNDHDLSEKSGFYFIFRNETDETWTVLSETKQSFSNSSTGDDYNNNLEEIYATTDRSRKTTK